MNDKSHTTVTHVILSILLAVMAWYIGYMGASSRQSNTGFDNERYDLLKQQYDKQIKLAYDSIAVLNEQIAINNNSIDSLNKKKNEKITIVRRSLNTNKDINDFLSNRYKDR
jgi:hypothetical protein